MGYLIITNNPLVRESYKNHIFIDGTIQDVFIKVRNLVHKGHKIISHPLPGSLKIMQSPFRSVIVSKEADVIDTYHLQVIEDSMTKLLEHIKGRGLDFNNKSDFLKLDLELLKSAFEENNTKKWGGRF